MQQSDIELYWKPVEDFKVSQKLTWQEVAERIGVTVAMLMMVKSGKRKLSAKAWERFREVRRERRASSPDVGFVLWPLKAAQESVIRLRGKGTFVQGIRSLVMDEFTKARMAQDAAEHGLIRVGIEHKTGDAPKGFPPTIELVAPSAAQGAEALVRFLAEIEEREILFACIGSKWRRVEFFDELLTPSAYALCYASCQLLAAAFNDECQAELQTRFDKLDTDSLVTAHEDLLRERDRLLMFYPEFYDFVSRVLNGELARRLKLDYKPARKAVKT